MTEENETPTEADEPTAAPEWPDDTEETPVELVEHPRVIETVGEATKTIPGFTQGVRVNAALRDMKLAQPICPHSKVEMERDALGVPRPKDVGPSTTNCQREGGKWWESCEKRGHDPFYTTHKWFVPQDVLEETSPGVWKKTGTDLIAHEERTLNVTAVAISIRHNQGKGVIKAIQNKGFKRLKDMGYYEVCQFRACQKPVSSKWKSKKYGEYCSRDHMALVAADHEGVALTYVHSEFNADHLTREQRRRDRELSEVLIGAVDD